MSKLQKLLLLLPLLAADGWIARSLMVNGNQDRPENASLSQFCVMGILFGALCILFAERMGEAHGRIGHSTVTPTPAPVVAAFGWLLVVLPAAIWVVTG